MKNSDSIALLQECNSGSKMAISSIRDVLGDIQEEKLKRLLENYIHKHEEYGEELHALLSANQSPPEEPKASGPISTSSLRHPLSQLFYQTIQPVNLSRINSVYSLAQLRPKNL